jgi:hypothetical protein
MGEQEGRKVAAVGLLLGLVGSALLGSDRRARKARRAAANAGREAEHSAKLKQLRALVVEVLAGTDLRDRKYRERYAHEHYDELMSRRERRRREIGQRLEWNRDPALPLLLREEPRAAEALERLQAELDLYQFVEGVTRADREIWQSKEFMRHQDEVDRARGRKSRKA